MTDDEPSVKIVLYSLVLLGWRSLSLPLRRKRHGRNRCSCRRSSRNRMCRCRVSPNRHNRLGQSRPQISPARRARLLLRRLSTVLAALGELAAPWSSPLTPCKAEEDLKGGRIDDLALVKFRETTEPEISADRFAVPFKR